MQTAKWILNRVDYPDQIVLSGQEEYSLGRSKDSYRAILSLCVSRKHCIFRMTENGLTVKDLNSANGTFVNENKIPPMIDVALNSNDVIGIGVPKVMGADTFVFILLNNEEKISEDARNIVDLTPKTGPNQDENKSSVAENLSFKSEPEENKKEDEVLLIEERDKFDIIDLSESPKDENIVVKNVVPLSASSFPSRTSPNHTVSVVATVKSDTIHIKKEKSSPTRRPSLEELSSTSEQNNIPSKKTSAIETSNIVHSFGNTSNDSKDCVHKQIIKPINLPSSSSSSASCVEKCASDCNLKSDTSVLSQIVKIENSSSNKENNVINRKNVSVESCLENKGLSLCKSPSIEENEIKKENTNNILKGESRNIEKGINKLVEGEKEVLISNKVKIESSSKILSDGQIKKEIVEDCHFSEIMKNTAGSSKQKGKINVDSFSREVNERERISKRSHKELSPDISLEKFVIRGSKKFKSASINSDLSASSSSSCMSADDRVSVTDSQLQSNSGDENPDKWFAKFSGPFLEQLESEVNLTSSTENTAETENRAMSICETKKAEALKCEEHCVEETIIKNQPVVVLKRLEDVMKDEKNSTPERDKCLDGNIFKNNFHERSLKLLNASPVPSEAHSKDSKTEMESQNHSSSMFTYSQSDDVIVIDDDDDDENIYDNNLEKETKYDPSNKNYETEESKMESEEICVKEEIFDDDDDGPGDDDDDDDIEILNWVSKLSQSLSPTKEDTLSLCPPKEKKRRIVFSDSSEEEIPLPFEREPRINNVVKDTKTLVPTKTIDLTNEETDHFALKRSSNSFIFDLTQMDSNNTREPSIENQDNDSDSDDIFGMFKSKKLKGSDVKCEKKLLTRPLNEENCDEGKLSNSEISLERYAEQILEGTFLEQTNKDPKEIKNTSEKMTHEVKVPSIVNKKTISINKPSNRRTTLLDCALPMKPKTKNTGRKEKMDSVIQNTSKEVQNSRFPPDRSSYDKSKEVLVSRMSSSSNSLSESERKHRVKEDRRAKLKALIEKQKSTTAEKIKEKVPPKCSLRFKNTMLSRGDKLAESLVANQSSKSKKEKIKVTVVMKKSEGDVLKPVKGSSTAEKILNHDTASSRVKPVEGALVPTRSKSSDIIPINTHNKRSENMEENPSVPEIAQQVRKLSFKDLPKIPKCKPSASSAASASSASSSKPHTSNMEKPHKAIKGKKSLKCVRSSLKTVASQHRKSVSFAPEESLCTVHVFEIDVGNSLRRVEGKDAPIRKVLADQAETLYDSSKMVLNRVITLILQFWNPRWIVEETVIAQNGGEPPPAHCQNTSVSALCPMLTSFSNYEEYWKIVEPLMLLDLWARVSEDAKRPNERTRQKYTLDVNDIKEANGILTVQCCMTISAQQDREKMHPHVGDLCVMRYPIWSSTYTGKESNELSQADRFIERFAYIESLTRGFYRSGKWIQGAGNTQNCKLNFVLKLKGESTITLIHPTLKVISSIRSDLRQFEAVAFLKHTKLCQMILNPSVLEYKISNGKTSSTLVTKDPLNDAQKSAVLKCASVYSSRAPKLCLIQGPPGTGKTKVIVNIIQQILYANDQYLKQRIDKRARILLCAPSNAAADEMVERLLAVRSEMSKELRFKMVRTGPKEHLREKVRGISLDELARKEVESSLAHQTSSLESVQIEISTLEARRTSYIMAFDHAYAKNENTDMYEKRILETEKRIAELKRPTRHVPNSRTSEMEKEARKKILSFADIVVTTLSSSFNSQMTEVFASRNGRSTARFTCCIIDEATQSKEPECLIPLMFGIEKIIMVGDPEQLPATVLSRVAKGKSFGQSLFNRIWNKFLNEAENPLIFLDTQYRMHPDIYKWPNTFIYNGKVRSHQSVLFQTPLKPYCVFAHTFQQNSQHLMNCNEALLVTDIARIIARGFPEHVKTIGIITPYQKQLQEIKKQITKSSLSVATLVNTIDGFQGRECDVIIFSCVRTRGLGFMGESQRLNVALTRARISLIICGNFISLRDDKMWSSLLNDAMQRNVLINYQNTILNQGTLLRHLLQH